MIIKLSANHEQVEWPPLPRGVPKIGGARIELLATFSMSIWLFKTISFDLPKQKNEGSKIKVLPEMSLLNNYSNRVDLGILFNKYTCIIMRSIINTYGLQIRILSQVPILYFGN